MVLMKDCVNFGYTQMPEETIDSMMAKIHTLPNCTLNKMVLGGCREDCQWYETY